MITQDTGFGKHIPTGVGLLSFSSVDGALAAIEAVRSDYARHAAAAREIAREYFDGRKVVGELLATAGIL